MREKGVPKSKKTVTITQAAAYKDPLLCLVIQGILQRALIAEGVVRHGILLGP